MPQYGPIAAVTQVVPAGDPIEFLGDGSQADATAQAMAAQAQAAATQLVGLVGSLVPPTISVDMPIDDVPPALSVPETPDFADAIWVSPELPEAFAGTLDVEDLMPEPFDEDAPTLAFPTAPSAFSEAAPTAPGVDLAFTEPTLDLTLPVAPDLLQVSVSPFAGITMPTFSAEEPTLDVVAPSIREYVPGAQYTSSLLTAMQASLLERITTGGTGLSAEVENAIWERGREREARAQADALRKLDDQMEALGYAFPPGAYLDARIKIITETDYAERGHSREVMVKSAELELDNVKHALTEAGRLESALVSYSNQVEQRLFDSTKYATEAGIAIYNAQVDAFGKLVDVYKTKVQIYEAQIRAEISKVDAYRAQIEAEKAKAETNTALVQQYRVQADVALSAIEIYKARIAGIQAKADIERAKIEVFGEQIKAYATRVNAYTAGVEGFRASIEAEKTKQQAYQSRVDAFRVQVEAAAKQIDARIAVHRGLIDAKQIEWEGYKATVDGETARINGLVEGNKSLAELYRSEVTGQASFNEVLTKQWQAVIERNTGRAEVAINAAKANAEMFVSTRSLATDAAKVSATVYGQIGAAALNTINWSNQVSKSYSFQNQSSNSYEARESNSYSYSYDENHNFSHT